VYSQKLIDCSSGGVHGDYCDMSCRVVVRGKELSVDVTMLQC
jgi:hypothetical protein